MTHPPPKELDSRTAVVTGSSTGIGRACALELARAGAAVLIHAAHRRQEAEAVAEEIRHDGGEATVVLADLADPAAHVSLIDEAWSWQGGIDIWVNNAGADVLTGAAAEWSFDVKLLILWQIDVMATIRLGRLVGDRMKQAGGGMIVNMGWDGAERGMAGDGAQLFAAAKGAVMAFSRSLAHTLAPEVRVNCVAPGWIRTAWAEQASEAWQRRAERESLLGRWGTPEDVARVVRFLVSPSADFLTGEIIRVNGGFRGS